MPLVTMETMTRISTNKIKYILIAIGAMIISSAPFWHIEFPKYSNLVTSKKEEVNFKRDSRNQAREVLIEELENYIKTNPNDKLSYLAKDYIQKKNIAKLNNNSLSLLKKNEVFFGYDSFRDFLYNFGMFMLILCLSLVIVNCAREFKSTNKDLSISVFIIGFTSLLVSLFFFNWAFFVEVDYSINVYHCVIVIVSVLIALSSFLFYKYKTTLFHKLKSTISYILKIRRVYITDLAIKAMDTDEEETINMVLDFENETKKELQKIVE